MHKKSHSTLNLKCPQYTPVIGVKALRAIGDEPDW